MPERPVTAKTRAMWSAALLLLVVLLLYVIANFRSLWDDWGPFFLLLLAVLIFFVKKSLDRLSDRPWT